MTTMSSGKYSIIVESRRAEEVETQSGIVVNELLAARAECVIYIYSVLYFALPGLRRRLSIKNAFVLYYIMPHYTIH